ncbi:hypothetical protein Aduo_019628 [Ancylostoma duodenale]
MSLGQNQCVPVDRHVFEITKKYFLPPLKDSSLTDALNRHIMEFYEEKFGAYAGWAQAVLFNQHFNQHLEKFVHTPSITKQVKQKESAVKMKTKQTAKKVKEVVKPKKKESRKIKSVSKVAKKAAKTIKNVATESTKFKKSDKKDKTKHSRVVTFVHGGVNEVEPICKPAKKSHHKRNF